MTDTFIDGGGVVPDAPLPAGTRIRFSPTGNPAEDVQVYVEHGRVHVHGMWRPIDVDQIAINALDIITVALPDDVARVVVPAE